MSISFILITFLLQMAIGMALTAAMLPPALIDKHFFKSISFWAFLFTLVALVLKHESVFRLPGIFGNTMTQVSILQKGSLFFFCLFGLLCAGLWWRIHFRDRIVTRGRLFLIACVGLTALVTDALLFRPNISPLWTQTVLVPFNFISASLLLGGFLTGMIFGHWYLVNTDMPKKLLVKMSWIMIFVLSIRILSVATSLWVYKTVIHPHSDFLNALVSFEGHGIFFWQRVLVGLGIPSVVVGLIWGTARIGSNQSATGIMYVAVAFVFIGELAARYLFLLSAIPL